MVAVTSVSPSQATIPGGRRWTLACRVSAAAAARASASSGSNRTRASSTSRSMITGPTLCAVPASCRSTAAAAAAGRGMVARAIRRARHTGSVPAITRAQSSGRRWWVSSASPR